MAGRLLDTQKGGAGAHFRSNESSQTLVEAGGRIYIKRFLTGSSDHLMAART